MFDERLGAVEAETASGPDGHATPAPLDQPASGLPGRPERVPHPHPAPPAPDDERLDAWRAFLFAQSTLLPRLDAELEAATGLSLAEFDALAQLAFAREGRLRMSQLAERVLLSRSGVTRLVDRLVRDGHVRREACAPDARGAFAVLTDQGSRRLRAAMPVHLAAVDAHFLAHLAPDDIATLSRALGRVAGANGRPVPSTERSRLALQRLSDTPD